MTLVSKTFELYGKTYTFESGELAKQATGACLVSRATPRCSTPWSSPRSARTTTSLPLTVDFNGEDVRRRPHSGWLPQA